MNVLKLVRILPLAVSSESNLPFCVLLIEATLELKLSIEPDNEELKVVIVLVNPLVVVATDEDKEPIDELIELLNVEYPVVPVKSTCIEPDINPLGLFAILSQVVCVIDPLNT